MGLGACGHHILGVFNMAWTIGDLKVVLLDSKVPMGDIDRDAIFSFGPQAIGRMCKIYFSIFCQIANLIF